jgi:trehalose 6-phosphate phosphatase
MTDGGLARAVTLARAALAAEPAGVLSDLDGTLATIVRDPAAVRLADGAAEALEALGRRLAVVGVVSGRAAHDARRIVGVPSMLVVGNHGLEWLEPGADATEATTAEATTADPRIRECLSAALARVPDEPGLVVEDKGLSATIHYRNAADPRAVRRRVLDALAPAIGPGLALREGRMSVELRPSGAGDKGTALAAVVARHGLRGLVVLGDDITDLDMFRAAADLRGAGRLRAAIIAVGGDGEVPSEVAANADEILPSPAEAVALLTAVAGD